MGKKKALQYGVLDAAEFKRILKYGFTVFDFLADIRDHLGIANRDTILHICNNSDIAKNKLHIPGHYHIYVVTVKRISDYLLPQTSTRSKPIVKKATWKFCESTIYATHYDFQQLTGMMITDGLRPKSLLSGSILYSLNETWRWQYLRVAYNYGLMDEVKQICAWTGLPEPHAESEKSGNREFIPRHANDPHSEFLRKCCISKGKVIVDRLPLVESFMNVLEWYHGSVLLHPDASHLDELIEGLTCESDD